MDQVTFTEAIGSVFEHSSWVTERAWAMRPFSSLANLHLTMTSVVQESSMEEKLALLRAHPDLAARVQMTDASVKEQAGIGLDQLSRKEYEDFLTLNRAYTLKFGFPFIMAVRDQNKESVRAAMLERVNYAYDAELEEALRQVYKIARFRLDDLCKDA